MIRKSQVEYEAWVLSEEPCIVSAWYAVCSWLIWRSLGSHKISLLLESWGGRFVDHEVCKCGEGLIYTGWRIRTDRSCASCGRVLKFE